MRGCSAGVTRAYAGAAHALRGGIAGATRGQGGRTRCGRTVTVLGREAAGRDAGAARVPVAVERVPRRLLGAACLLGAAVSAACLAQARRGHQRIPNAVDAITCQLPARRRKTVADDLVVSLTSVPERKAALPVMLRSLARGPTLPGAVYVVVREGHTVRCPAWAPARREFPATLGASEHSVFLGKSLHSASLKGGGPKALDPREAGLPDHTWRLRTTRLPVAFLKSGSANGGCSRRGRLPSRRGQATHGS